MKTLKTYKQLFEVKIDKDIVVSMMVYNSEFDNLEKYLNDGGNINILDKQNKSLLHIAAIYNNIEMCKFLIKHNIDMSKTCLSSILISDRDDEHYDVIKYLLNVGFDINNKCISYYSPVLCYTSKSPKTTQLLIDYGVNIDDVDEWKQTGLMWAIRDNRLDVIKILVESGANINHLDHNKKNCLFKIKRGTDVELIEYLIESGVDYTHVDLSGEDFFDYLMDIGLVYDELEKYSKKYTKYMKQMKAKKFNL